MPEVSPSKWLTMASWEDVPHLDAKTKAELWASTPAHLRAARAQGIPVLGSGAVFPIPEEDILVDPFPIPDHWAHIAGMDFGWDHPWAAVHLAWDREKDALYVIKDFRQSNLTPIRAKEALSTWDLKWLPWAWPHDGHQHEKGTGDELAPQYRKQGFDMLPEHAQFSESEGGGNSLEAGILEMLNRMETGRWKVFRTCALWVEEYRLYHRDNGIIVKVRDDVISASRYAMLMRRYAKRRPSAASRGLRINSNWRTG